MKTFIHVVFIFLLSYNLYAQRLNAELILDANPGSSNSFNTDYEQNDRPVLFKNYYYYHSGTAVYKTDANRTSTDVVVTGEKGAAWSAVVIDNILYFTNNRNEIWATDGTPGNAHLVISTDYDFIAADEGARSFYRIVDEGDLDIDYDNEKYVYIFLFEVNGNLLFQYASTRNLLADYAFYGFIENYNELWKVYPSSNSYEMLANIVPENGGTFNNITNVKMFVECEENGADCQYGAFEPDLKEVYSKVVYWNNKLFFVTVNGDFHWEVWATDGTKAGTFRIYTIPSDFYPTDIRDIRIYKLNNRIIIKSPAGIFSTQGDISGNYVTVQEGEFKEVSPRLLNYYDFIFYVNNPSLNKSTLKVTNGLPTNTYTLTYLDGIILETKVVGNNMFFKLHKPDGRIELWITDGTRYGTKNLGSGLAGLIDLNDKIMIYNNRLYSIFESGSLWSMNLNGTDLKYIKNIEGEIEMWNELNSQLYFITSSPSTTATTINDKDYYYWKTDGTEENTIHINTQKNFLLETYMYSPFTTFFFPSRYLFKADNFLFFKGYTAENGNELWAIDGTTDDVFLVEDINLNNGNGINTINWIREYRGNVLFMAQDGTTGTELWKVPVGPYVGELSTLLPSPLIDCGCTFEDDPDNPLVSYPVELSFYNPFDEPIEIPFGEYNFIEYNGEYTDNLTPPEEFEPGWNTMEMELALKAGETLSWTIRDKEGNQTKASFTAPEKPYREVLFDGSNGIPMPPSLLTSNYVEIPWGKKPLCSEEFFSMRIISIKDKDGKAINNEHPNFLEKEIWVHKEEIEKGVPFSLEELSPRVTYQYNVATVIDGKVMDYGIGNLFTTPTGENEEFGKYRYASDQISIERNDGIWAYPNPVTDQLTISMKHKIEGNYIILLMDVTGREVFKKQVEGSLLETIDLKNLKKGLYVIEVNNGFKKFAQKIIKE